VIGNLLLVLGVSLVAGGSGGLDRFSSLIALAGVAVATAFFLIPSVPGWEGDPNRHALAVISVPVSIALLLIYLVGTIYSLRRHRTLHQPSANAAEAWSFRRSLGILGVATVVTALVAEVLVGSLEPFAEQAGLSDFFVAAVIVAIVGNAAEHGGAVVVAHRGKISLAAEISLSSAAQVAVFLIPAVALLSWLPRLQPLALAFRPVEIAALAGATAFTVLVLWGGQSSRRRGVALLAAYGVVVVAFYAVGDRGS
jgi:Ca2+:H+ antiporter